jgi:predicted KAP-like P-loop ATPase
LGRTVNYISCVFIGYKNVFGPIAVLVTNRFRLEQKSYLPLKLEFMSDFGQAKIFNGLLDNRPNVFCWASDYLIWNSFWSPE